MHLFVFHNFTQMIFKIATNLTAVGQRCSFLDKPCIRRAASEREQERTGGYRQPSRKTPAQE